MNVMVCQMPSIRKYFMYYFYSTFIFISNIILFTNMNYLHRTLFTQCKVNRMHIIHISKQNIDCLIYMY